MDHHRQPAGAADLRGGLGASAAPRAARRTEHASPVWRPGPKFFCQPGALLGWGEFSCAWCHRPGTAADEWLGGWMDGHGNRLVAFASSYLLDRDLAQDAVQEAFLRGGAPATIKFAWAGCTWSPATSPGTCCAGVSPMSSASRPGGGRFGPSAGGAGRTGDREVLWLFFVDSAGCRRAADFAQCRPPAAASGACVLCLSWFKAPSASGASGAEPGQESGGEG